MLFLSENYLWRESQSIKQGRTREGLTVPELASKLGRTEHPVDCKIRALGLRNTDTSEIRRILIAKLREQNETSCFQRKMLSENKARVLSREKYRRRIEQNVCVRCGGPQLPHVQMCLLHWAVCIGYSCGHNDEAFGQQLLQKLKNQNYKCALSGLELVPGLNASIDHKIARSKGGPLDDLANLQWILTPLNRGRGDLSVEEFIAMCCAVARWQA